MDKEMCEQIRKRVDEKIFINETRINGHSKRIDILEQRGVRLEERLDNIIHELSRLSTAIWWFIGTVVITLIGFFIWYIQKLGG